MRVKHIYSMYEEWKKPSDSARLLMTHFIHPVYQEIDILTY